jgi:hypothetical protein
MDLTVFASFLFVLMLAGMGLGTILLFPIMRRLGAVLEQRLQNRPLDDALVTELRSLGESIQAVQHQLAQLSERQARLGSEVPEADHLRLPVGSGKD